MKIILSPSKTKQMKGLPEVGLFCQEMTDQLVMKMANLSVTDIMKLQKLKEDKAQEQQEFWQAYDNAPTGMAVLSYSGLAFKNLGWENLDKEAQEFGREHLVILSALYGVVLPQSPLKNYRLDLVDPLFRDEKRDFYQFWGKAVNDFFSKEDWILNLASKEYSKLVEHPRIISVEFWEDKQGKMKQLSTTSKQMRGCLAHEVLKKQITETEHLPETYKGFTKMVIDEKLIHYVKK